MKFLGLGEELSDLKTTSGPCWARQGLKKMIHLSLVTPPFSNPLSFLDGGLSLRGVALLFLFLVSV